MMNNIILSLKMVFLFFAHEDKLKSFLQQNCLIEEHDFLVEKSRKISSFIAAFFPMFIIITLDRVGFKESFLEMIGTSSKALFRIVSFVVAFILSLSIDTVVRFVFVFRVVSKYKSTGQVDKMSNNNDE